MTELGIQGLPTRRKRRPNLSRITTVIDLVDRKFTALGPNKLWVTDVTAHPTTWIPAFHHNAAATGQSLQKDYFSYLP